MVCEAQAATPSKELQGRGLEEVIVTAQKQEERLQDVPVPVTAIDAEVLVNSNQLRLQDYYTKVPGLGLALVGPEAAPTLAIRGLTMSGGTNPTVAMVVDEVPYGSTVTIGNFLAAADIDPGDLARVEVLRGPQGTLYGASSLGGLLKFATVDPSTEGMSARLQAGMTSVESGDDLGYNVRGSVNMPVGDSFALRASGFTTRDPGYIDNVQSGERDVNERDSDGGRLSALWRPSESFSLKLSALRQDSERRGSADVHLLPGVGDLQQRAVPETGGYIRESEAYGATITAAFGDVDLTSATGYNVDKTESVQDVSPSFFGGRALATFGVGGAANLFERTVDKFTQEVRLTVHFGEKFDWLVGTFYTREKVDAASNFWALDPTTGARVGQLIRIHTPDNRFEEYAAFTDLTVHFTDRFDVQLGGRFSENEQSFFTVRTGPLVPVFFPGSTSPQVVPEASGRDHTFTYLVTPRLKLSPDLMVYARFASGYRPGAPNVNCGLVPCKSTADTTKNYEIGMKGSALNEALSFDASVYYIDWQDIQLNVIVNGLGYVANAGRAKSQGVELAIESRPLAGLTLSTWVAFNDAELTEAFPPGPSFGRPGDRLPYGGRLSGNLSVDQEFPIGSRMTGLIGTSVSYVDERKGVFRGAIAGVPLPRQIFPAYAQVDLRAGVTYDSWSVNAFVNNLADKRALAGGGFDNTLVPTAVNYIQPRTVGLSFTKTF